MKQVFLVAFFVLGMSNFAMADSDVDCVMEKESQLFSNAPTGVFIENRSQLIIAASIICMNGGTVSCVIEKESRLFSSAPTGVYIENRSQLIIAAAHLCKGK